MSEPAITPVAVAPGKGVSVGNPVGGALAFTLTGEESAGALTAIETVAARGADRRSTCTGTRTDWFTPLEGLLKVKLADQLVDAPAGSFVFIPRGTPHTGQNAGDASARFFAAVMPAATGFEQSDPS